MHGASRAPLHDSPNSPAGTPALAIPGRNGGASRLQNVAVAESLVNAICQSLLLRRPASLMGFVHLL
jgi:hypothetical protein